MPTRGTREAYEHIFSEIFTSVRCVVNVEKSTKTTVYSDQLSGAAHSYTLYLITIQFSDSL